MASKKEPLKKEVECVPSIRFTTNSWKDRQIDVLNVYKVHKSRTCDVFLMAESNESCSTAVEKFTRSVKLDSTNIIKAVTYNDILANIKKFSCKDNNAIAGEALYSYLAREATKYLNDNKNVPLALLKDLIKLQIAFVINQDVAEEQWNVQKIKYTEDECAALVDEKIEVAGKKGKPAKGAKPAGKPAKSASKKSDNKPVVYDVCDSKNELKLKNTSILLKANLDHMSIRDDIEVEQKHLFIIIVGIYDFNIIEELFKSGVTINGIVELPRPPHKIKKLTSHSCICLQSMQEWDTESEDEKSLEFDPFWKPYLVKKTPNSESEKSKIIFDFWQKIYEYLESDDECCPECLNDSFHMTISLSEDAYEYCTINDDKHCLTILSDIGTEIKHWSDIKRQYTNYIRNLKLCSVESKPVPVTAKYYNTYNNFMNTIPPDCTNVFIITHALVEQVCKDVPDPPSIILETPPPSIPGSNKSSTSKVNTFSKASSDVYRGIKGQIANILYKNINVHASIKNTKENNKKYRSNPKIDLKITNKVFLIQENCELEAMANTYTKITSRLLDINMEKLIQSTPAFLLKGYPYDEITKQNVFNKTYNLQATADYLEIPVKELQYVIHMIFLSSLNCGYHKDYNHILCSLQWLFPKKEFIETPTVLKTDIPYQFNIKRLAIDGIKPLIEIPYVEYQNVPNIYEAKNILAYKWYETLPQLATLEELYKAERDYICLDYKYCSFNDSLLLRYHNCVDEFGISTTKWNQSLRTPINTIREFCRYIIHVESKWLKEEEDKYAEKFQKKYDTVVEEECKLKRNFYPELVFKDIDFIQRGSIKWKEMQAELKEEKPEEKIVDKKAGKSGKSSDSKAKVKDSKKSVKSGKIEVAPSAINQLEKLSKPILPPAHSKASFHCAEEGKPFSFFAYDISNNIVQLTDSTTVFHSQDGFKVIVDQTRFVGKPKNLSINICINNHCLILHHNHVTALQPFTFHFALSDQSIISFERPSETLLPEEKLSEKICQALKNKRKDPEKRQEIYFVTAKHSSVIKCLKVPYITKKKLVLSEDLILPFMNQLNLRRINVKLRHSAGLSSTEIKSFEKAFHKSHSEVRKSKSPDENIIEPKYVYNIISKIQPGKEFEKEENISIPEEDLKKLEKKLSDDSISTPQLLEKSNKRLLREIRRVADLHLPIFKICSSRLHKYQYVKRIKPHIEIPIGNVLKRIPCKPPVFKSRVDLKVSKLLPVTPCVPTTETKRHYNIKICLPSGLLIQSVDGIDNLPFHIRQKYLDLGPQCKNIKHEYSRTFLRNGMVLIKKLDGNIDILDLSGQIVKCEIPYLKIKSEMPTDNKKKCFNPRSNNLIPIHTPSLTKFQKQLHKTIKRLHKHLIDGYKSQHLISRKACQKWKKKYVKDPNQVYILQKDTINFKRFTLMTTDGRSLKITPTLISQRKKYYTSTAADHRYQEIYYTREDGTHSILNHDSLLITQFPDGTRLTSWIEVEHDPILLEKKNEVIEENVKHVGHQVNDFDFLDSINDLYNSQKQSTNSFETIDSEEGVEVEEEEEAVQEDPESKKELKFPIDDVSWVSIHLNVKYEHPNYATVIYHGKSNNTEIILPNDITIKGTESGDYAININQDIYSKITTKQILLESTPCKACLQKDVNILNIKPLYYKFETNLHETELLRTVDSFKKIFIVNYAGQCFRNTKYIQKRNNIVKCKQHINNESQKVFILNRSLVGCKLWNVESYRQHLTKAKKTETHIKQNKSYIELQTMIRKPHHEKFLIPYEQPTLTFTKNKPTISPPKELAYIAKQVIKNLPDLKKFYQIFLIISQLLNTKCSIISDSIGHEFKKFITYAIDEILGKHIKPEEKIILRYSLQIPPPLPSPKIQKIPFALRRQKRANECKEHWEEIRKGIPKYFASTHYHNIINKDKMKRDTHDAIADEYDVKEERVDHEPTLKIASKTETQEMTVEPKRPSHDEKLQQRKLTPRNIQALATKRLDSQLFTPPWIPTPEDIDERINEPGKKQTWWSRNDLGKFFLREIRNRLIKAAVENESDKSEEVSREKISEATHNLFADIRKSVQKYEIRMSIGDFIERSINTAIENVLKMQLHPIELVLLLDNVAHEKQYDDDDKQACTAVLSSLVTGDTSGDKFKSCQTEPIKQINNDAPYFGVYEHYKHDVKVVHNEQPPSNQASFKMVFEKQNSSSKTSLLTEVTENNSITESICKSDVPQHTDGHKFTFHNYDYKCQQCIAIKAKSEPQLQQITEQLVDSETATLEHIKPDLSMTSSEYTSLPSCIQEYSSSIMPVLDLPSDSSLLNYCLSEKIAPIETDGGNTVILHTNYYKESESKLVLFSVNSLKQRKLELLEPSPYIQRDPNEPMTVIKKIISDRKEDTPSNPMKKKNLVYEPIKPPERESSKALIRDKSLHECKKCILRLDDNLSNKLSDSFSEFKTRSIVSLLTTQKAHSDENLSVTDKEKIKSLVSIFTNLSTIQPHLPKRDTNNLVSTITDRDVKIAKGVLPADRGEKVLRAIRMRPVVRKTVGSQTPVNDVQDHNNQTFEGS